MRSIKSVEDINQLRDLGLAQHSTAALYLVFLAQKNFSKLWCQGLRTTGNHTSKKTPVPYLIKDYLNLSWFYAHDYPLPQSADEILQIFRLRGMSEGAQQAWDYWRDNPDTLVLYNHIPNVKEVLSLQAQGKRCITMIAKNERLNEEIFAGKNAYQFLIHDLEHAACFFKKGEWKEGQIGLYRFMLNALKCTQFENTLSDVIYKEKLNYVLSDMNAHCIHLIKYFKGILIEHVLRKFGQKSFERMNLEGLKYLQTVIEEIGKSTNAAGNILSALLALNNPGEEKYFLILEQFFNQYERRSI